MNLFPPWTTRPGLQVGDDIGQIIRNEEEIRASGHTRPVGSDLSCRPGHCPFPSSCSHHSNDSACLFHLEDDTPYEPTEVRRNSRSYFNLIWKELNEDEPNRHKSRGTCCLWHECHFPTQVPSLPPHSSSTAQSIIFIKVLAAQKVRSCCPGLPFNGDFYVLSGNFDRLTPDHRFISSSAVLPRLHECFTLTWSRIVASSYILASPYMRLSSVSFLLFSSVY